MNLCSIASGSSGNCIYAGTDRTHILLDTGISRKKIVEGLHSLGLKPEDLGAILITHEHIDHIKGLGVMARSFSIPIYATRGTIEGIRGMASLGEFDESLFHEIRADDRFMLNDIEVRPVRISHDAREPVAYVLAGGGNSVGVVTDLGMYDDDLVERLQGLDALLLEANHDIHMLQAGRYPYYLKQRILGEKGHLSNENSGRLLARILHDKLKTVILGHLSKENNYEKLAYETVRCEIRMGDRSWRLGDFSLRIAKRDQVSEVVHI